LNSTRVACVSRSLDIAHHQQITARRNFDKVNFGNRQIMAWCVRRSFTGCTSRQRQGYSMLVIEFRRVGTPERPLSDLATCLPSRRSALPSGGAPRRVGTARACGHRPGTTRPPRDAAARGERAEHGRRRDVVHCALADVMRAAPGDDAAALATLWCVESVPNADDSATGHVVVHRARRPGTTLRRVESALNADGSATTHVCIARWRYVTRAAPRDDAAALATLRATTHVVVHCALVDVTRATHLPVEDAAFTLSECGLLIRQVKGDEEGVEGEGEGE
ncbi:hypothetical protein FA95DRAFT_1652246, partial [Auriscalpium vulgare]